MKLFRLKDPITNLYYCPVRDIRVKHESGQSHYCKSNLSKKGKVYFSSQPLEKNIYDHTQPIWKNQWSNYWYAKPLTRLAKLEIEYL